MSKKTPKTGPELADALDSGSSPRKRVEVQVLSWAPSQTLAAQGFTEKTTRDAGSLLEPQNSTVCSGVCAK